MKRNLIYHTQVPLEIPAKVHSEDMQQSTQVTRIARDGLALSCDRLTLDRLFPNTPCVSPKQSKHIEVTLSMPNSKADLTILCEMFALRRLSRDCFEMEVKFENLDDDSSTQIDQFVENHLKSHDSDWNQAA